MKHSQSPAGPMKKNHSIRYNFIMNFLLTASSILFPLITFPYVSRVLQVEGTGKVAFATSIITYFTMISMLGIPTYGIRAVARVRQDSRALKQVVHELLVINLVMCAFSYVLFAVCLLLIPQMAAQKTLMVVCSSAILLNSLGMNWFFQGMEDYTWITLASIVFKVISVITMVLFVRSPDDYIWYGVMTVLSSYGSGIVNLFRLPRYITDEKVEYHYIRHLRPILIFFAMSVATTIYTHLDTAMLGLMKGDYEVGLYNAGIKVKTLLVSLITSLGTVLLPRLSAYIAQGEKKEFLRIVSKAISFVLLFSVPVCVYCIVYTPDILVLLSGKSYLPATACMQILMPTIILVGLSNLTGIQILVPLNREKQVLTSVASGAVLDFVLNLLLIPYAGAAGASIGTLSAEILVLAVQIWFLRAHVQQVLGKIEWKPFVLGMAAFSIVCLCCSNFLHLHVFLNLLISSVLCFSVYGVCMILTREEIVMGVLRHK